IELNGTMVEKNLAAFEWGRATAHHGEHAVAPGLASVPVIRSSSNGIDDLDQVIQDNAKRLRDYQNAAYARRYTKAVASIRRHEEALQAVGQDEKAASRLPLTRAVATNLAKLMAYKDEYEVARLYADPAFTEKLRAQFEGEPGRDYQLRF